MDLTDEEIQSKVKTFQEAFFEALMGFPCTVRFYKDGSLGYVVSAKEMDRLAAGWPGLERLREDPVCQHVSKINAH
jgi:hypothetical protein